MSSTSSQELTIICKNVSKCSKGFANSSQEITIIGESENKVQKPLPPLPGVLGVAATLGCQLRLRDGNDEAKVRKWMILNAVKICTFEPSERSLQSVIYQFPVSYYYSYNGRSLLKC